MFGAWTRGSDNTEYVYESFLTSKNCHNILFDNLPVICIKHPADDGWNKDCVSSRIIMASSPILQ